MECTEDGWKTESRNDCEARILCLPNSVELGGNQAIFCRISLGLSSVFLRPIRHSTAHWKKKKKNKYK